MKTEVCEKDVVSVLLSSSKWKLGAGEDGIVLEILASGQSRLILAEMSVGLADLSSRKLVRYCWEQTGEQTGVKELLCC